jgi:AcrR family transcriptional regulator
MARAREADGVSAEQSWRAEPGTDVYGQMRERVIEAAERYVERHGLARVRIEEIAEEADCSRATIYRYFADKDELIRQVLVRRSRRIAARLAKLVDVYDDPSDLLVQGIARGIEEFRRDEYFESFYGPATAGTTARIAGGSTTLRAVVAEALKPLFDLAEATGRLREGVTRDEATEWVMLVTTALLTIPLPDVQSREEQEAFLRKFLVPAVLSPA